MLERRRTDQPVVFRELALGSGAAVAIAVLLLWLAPHWRFTPVAGMALVMSALGVVLLRNEWRGR